MIRFALTGALALGLSTVAGAGVVDFDTPQTDAVIYGPLTTPTDIQGLTFQFSGTGYGAVWDGNSPNSNGTRNLILADSPSSIFQITRTGGGAFNLQSIDLVISWYSAATNANVLVNGNPLAITNTLTTYALNLNNVTSVTISGLDTGEQTTPYWSGDNLVYTAGAAVPEPATWALMIGGFGLAGMAARTRRSTVRYA